MSSTIGFKRKCSHASVVSEKAIQDAAAARIQIPLGPPFGKGGSYKDGELRGTISSAPFQTIPIASSPL
jgi:hypothetical protein